MNLRDQLKEILPEILPSNPADAIKGTELIRLVKYRLKQEYSDATLRYHFSIMCCDPSSPIAKVEQGQGYYLRRLIMKGPPGQVTPEQLRLGLMLDHAPEALDKAVSRQQKLREIFLRDAEDTAGRFVYLFETSAASYQNVWDCPDAALIDWQIADIGERGVSLDRPTLALKRALGAPPVTITSVKFRVELGYSSFREVCFQAISNGRWAHRSELVIASAITEASFIDELRQLGMEYGLGITSLGLSLDKLDDLVPGYEVQNMRPREFEALQEEFNIQVICPPAPRSIDWRVVERARRDNPEIQGILDWISSSMDTGVARSWRDWQAEHGDA